MISFLTTLPAHRRWKHVWIAVHILYVVAIHPMTQFLEIFLHKGRGYSYKLFMIFQSNVEEF